jgi:ribose transport system substrate-binding protein
MGAQEAAKAIGWDFRILDGQGSVPARSSALTQAIALKPAGIILGTIDAAEQAPIIEQAVAAGIKVVGWHSGAAPGKINGVPGVITNITTDPLEVAKAAGLYAVVDPGGKANVVLFTDLIYAIATAKTDAEKAAVSGCTGCKVLSVEDTPIGDLSNRMGQLTTSLLSKYGKEWTYSIAVNDLYYDFSAPPLQAAGSIRPQAILGKSPLATARCPHSSVSVTSDTRSRLSPSRCTCTAGSASMN